MKCYAVMLAALFSLVLAGCGSNVDAVRDGTLLIDETVTIGGAIEGCSWVKSVKWKEFETDQGRQIVEAKAVLKNEPHLKNAPNFNSSKEDNWSKPLKLLTENLGTMTYTMQFAMTRDGESFEPLAANLTVTYRKKDGSDGIEEVNDEDFAILVEMYEGGEVSTFTNNQVLRGLWLDYRFDD